MDVSIPLEKGCACRGRRLETAKEKNSKSVVYVSSESLTPGIPGSQMKVANITRKQPFFIVACPDHDVRDIENRWFTGAGPGGSHHQCLPAGTRH